MTNFAYHNSMKANCGLKLFGHIIKDQRNLRKWKEVDNDEYSENEETRRQDKEVGEW